MCRGVAHPKVLVKQQQKHVNPLSLDVKSRPSALLCLLGGRISVKEGGTRALRASKTNIKRLKSVVKHAGNKYRCKGQGCFQKAKRLVNTNVKVQSVTTIQSGANGSVASLLKVPSCRGRVGPSLRDITEEEKLILNRVCLLINLDMSWIHLHPQNTLQTAVDCTKPQEICVPKMVAKQNCHF